MTRQFLLVLSRKVLALVASSTAHHTSYHFIISSPKETIAKGLMQNMFGSKSM